MPTKLETLLVLCNETGVSLQQIPVDIREAFEPAPGCQFVAIDYSQMEYKVFASLSKDPKLIAAINSGRDFHKEMAAMLFDVKFENVTKDQRSIGKTINLALLFGLSDYGLALRMKTSESEARKIRQIYNTRFPVAVKWIEAEKQRIKKEKQVSTYFGRIRKFGNGVRGLTDEEVNEGFNTMIQGTAADIIKIAMTKTHEHLNSVKIGKLSLSLHDELLFEIRKESVAEQSNILKKIMTEELGLPKDWAKFSVDVSIGDNWKQAS